MDWMDQAQLWSSPMALSGSVPQAVFLLLPLSVSPYGFRIFFPSIYGRVTLSLWALVHLHSH